jgi:hypothetical protein
MRLQRSVLGLDGKPTLGAMTGKNGGFSCAILERSANGPHPCIPAGLYVVRRAVHHPGTEHAYPCWELDTSHLNPVRTYIHIHIANRAEQLRGCLATGERVGDDGECVESSEVAFGRLMEYTKGLDTWMLEILDPPARAP